MNVILSATNRKLSASEKAGVTGKVSLVGAGPGDPDLITVKGLRILQQADIVVYDRLVAKGLLNEARADAVLIDVGKRPKQHPVPQQEIHKLLIRYASAGQHVVRLKGGDPFVFGRGFEELQMCQAHGVPCEVIPGLSSSLAGPAAAGIPVTARGIARSLAIVTSESGKTFADPNHDWNSLARLDTIVILMGRRKLSQTAIALIAAGKPDNTPVACIERATLSAQRVIQGTLATISENAERKALESPMVMVVGKVAAHASKESVIQSVTQFVGEQTRNHV